MAIINTECMIHIKPSKRHTWGYHSMKAWYFAPALKHYCCIKVVTDTGAVRITDMFKFLHHTLPIPTVSSTNRIAGCLANKLLAQHLDKEGYYQCQYLPRLWRHKWRPITFSLVVDDFGIKTIGLLHAKHLKTALEKYYEVTVDWKGELFCGITLHWDFKYGT
ncbi:hypothetical protein ACHAW6_005346, partial [Cyclotella cf. meneghiniana]